MASAAQLERWTDFAGRPWPVVRSPRRLKFKYPAHAALRRHCFHRDGYACRRCPAKALDVPANYDGRETLFTNTMTRTGWRDMLVLDHVLTLKAGGLSVIGNLQTLCETCNRRKVREDKEAARVYAIKRLAA